jgi:sulfur carrier protein ThiS adenylyltransferase
MVDRIRKVLEGKVVGIAGCGGLGSNCAIALARVGLGHLILVDFDEVDFSNLNRQYFFLNQVGEKKATALKENILQIDPGLKVDSYNIKLDALNIPLIFKDCDVIVEAFDLAEMKHMLIETVLSELPGKYIVSGVGLAGYGDSNMIRVNQSDNLIVCGDGVTEVSDQLPPLAPRVGLVANMQANEVLRILLKEL